MVGDEHIIPRSGTNIQPVPSDVNIEVKNLIVSQQSGVQLAVGDLQSLKAVLVDREVSAIVWNEDTISLITSDRSTEIWFRPEITPSAELFFSRKDSRHRDMWTGETTLIWEGDYEPVRFTKRNLLKFFKKYADALPPDVAKSIKSMKLVETKTEDSIMLGEDTDDEKTVVEHRQDTNIPKKFNMRMEITPGFLADLECEAAVVSKKEGIYDAVSRGDKMIEIRCTNAREVKRDMMSMLCNQLPPEIPRYYGRYRVKGGKD